MRSLEMKNPISSCYLDLSPRISPCYGSGFSSFSPLVQFPYKSGDTIEAWHIPDCLLYALIKLSCKVQGFIFLLPRSCHHSEVDIRAEFGKRFVNLVQLLFGKRGKALPFRERLTVNLGSCKVLCSPGQQTFIYSNTIRCLQNVQVIP